jgi:hypothetical protein
MTDREEFEQWARRIGYADEFDVPLMKHAAYEGWQARQPEIDALKAEVERLRKDAEPASLFCGSTDNFSEDN